MKKAIFFLSIVLFISCGNDPAKTNSEVAKDSMSTVQKEDPRPFLGQSAQIVIGTSKQEETVEFYETLGWEAVASEVIPLRWDLLYDGSTMLIVREDTVNHIGFDYHSDEAIRIFNKLSIAEIKPIMLVSNPETNELLYNIYESPDSIGFRIVIEPMEMMDVTNAGKIFSAKEGTKFEFVNPVAGTFQELALSVDDLDESIEYWESLGFVNNGIKEEPYRYTIAYDGLMILGLHETKGMWDGNTFTYSGNGVEENKSALKSLQANGFAQDVEAMVYGDMVFEGNFLIPDPAGNMFMLTTDLSILKK